MLFVKQFSTIKIPDVNAIYSHGNEENKRLPINYIVMENIVGYCLDSCWASLDTQTKSAIVDQLRICFTQLRQIPSPGYYGLVERRPYDNHIFWANNEEERRMISGPFDSEEQMLEALMQKYVYNLPKYRKHEYYSRMLPLVLRDHAPVFTHGDLQRKNVLARKDGTVIMIDWEAAGWFPSFWEYAMALFSCRWNDDWHSWVVKVIVEYPNEYAWMDMLFRELWS